MDESLHSYSLGLKEAVVNLKEVTEGLKETSVRMQNATLALLEGQKRLESGPDSGVKQTKEKKKACKRFRRHRKKFLLCKRRSRNLNRNQGFDEQVYLLCICLCTDVYGYRCLQLWKNALHRWMQRRTV